MYFLQNQARHCIEQYLWKRKRDFLRSIVYQCGGRKCRKLSKDPMKDILDMMIISEQKRINLLSKELVYESKILKFNPFLKLQEPHVLLFFLKLIEVGNSCIFFENSSTFIGKIF